MISYRSLIRWLVQCFLFAIPLGVVFPKQVTKPTSMGWQLQFILGANGEGKQAQALLNSGHPAEAEKAAEADLHTMMARASFGSFSLLLPYNNLGVVYATEGKYSEAHKMFARAIGLGRAAVSQGEMTSGYSAGSTYRQAGAGGGKGVEVQKKLLALCLMNNAATFRMEGKMTEAISLEHQAHKLDPNLPLPASDR
ncbi:hypothetical protein A7K73_06910 [Candidatus Methylacidiphilum fumarolicum]|uniref:Tetratricopeptide repeat protein n=2 Tax=Candidatus Methylacidiphilum fumarolicum TaxID=591154 RepID=I0JZJ7_METFB|nr:hypothetical protein [Candidatus Methylacidiphilum fumarolicum]MBW6415445.1 hypothetical protein [Candidatus Methylacidiphilum fumarolicum]TFE69017.1 hypothetical protein A7K73_06910 [Candidatus Methylacidiphilum fumarolicum]TFE74152.1 hypothetical protein A7D33_02110 [Candidatus Methylacidiphilum fumarolicum]CAI9085218.1 conserved protein of unknown function [Candidatus Methylacidiphilum fumarolicum]CCG92666.1 hypothetical protein MFUM_720033 [Methylacidiphilum fumariolicum SolV]